VGVGFLEHVTHVGERIDVMPAGACLAHRPTTAAAVDVFGDPVEGLPRIHAAVRQGRQPPYETRAAETPARFASSPFLTTSAI
jgi:hypothetical protein